MDFGLWGDNKLDADDIGDEIDEHEDRLSKFKQAAIELDNGIEKVQKAEPLDWIRYTNRDDLIRYTNRDPAVGHPLADRRHETFLKSYRIPSSVLSAIDDIFTEYEPFSSESEKEAELRSQRVEKLLVELKEEIENEVIPEMEENIENLRRLQHEIEAGEKVKEDDLDSSVNEVETNRLEDFAPISELDTELQELEVEKEMNKKQDDFDILTLEETAYLIAEDMRRQLDKDYDIEHVTQMENTYARYVGVLRNNIQPTHDKELLHKRLSNFHDSTEHINAELTDAQKMYIVRRVFDDVAKITVDELRTY